MNKNLHDIDDLFRSALGEYEATPSAEIKQNLETALDKRDSDTDKIKFTAWKKTTLFLLLLLAGFNLYELTIFKNGYDNQVQQIADKNLNEPLKEKPNITDHLIKSKDISTAQSTQSYEKSGLQKRSHQTNNTVTGERNNIKYKKKNDLIFISNENTIEKGNNRVSLRGIPAIQQNTLKKETLYKPTRGNFQQPTNGLTTGRISGFPIPEAVSISKIIAEISNSIKKMQPGTDSFLKQSKTRNTQEAKVKSLKPFWMITAFASYERAGYRLDSDIPNNITSIKHSEVQEPSFSLGVLTTRQLKKHLGLQTGLTYSQTDIGIIPQKLFALQDPGGDIAFKYVTSSGYAYIKPGLGAPPAIGDSLITTEGKHRLRSVSIPLVIKYSIGKKKLTFNPGIGFEANFVTSAKVETEIERPSNPEIVFINKLNGTKRVFLSVIADAEVRYKLNHKLSLSLRPTLRLATSPITENNVVETFPKSIGTGIGLTWKF